MIRLITVIVFAVASSGFVCAQPPAAGVGPVVVNQKKLRENLGARVVEWDPKSRVLRLTYDFHNIKQAEDWQLPNRKVNATGLGIQIAAGERLEHKVVFTEARCAFRYSCGGSDQGTVIAAGGDVTVTTYPRNIGRCFAVNGKQKAIGKIKGGVPISIALVVKTCEALLCVNNGEVADACQNNKPFHFDLLGGNNGAEFGELEIKGKPDEEWLKAL